MNWFSSLVSVVYGTVVMAMILDVRPTELSRQKRIFAAALGLAVFIANAAVLVTAGQAAHGSLYPVLVYLPLYVGYCILSRYRGIKLLFTMLSAIVFTAPSVMCVTVLRAFVNIGPITVAVVYVLCSAAVLLFTWRVLKADFNYMLEHCENARFWLFSAIPILYYVYIFAKTKYDFSQVMDIDGLFLRQIPTVIVILSYILVIRIFRSARENQRLQDEANLNHIQMEAANLRLTELNRTQEQTRQYRHDMRHHFTYLQALATEGDLARINEYLNAARSDLDAFTPARYCENETANLLFSSFVARAAQAGVSLTVKTELPREIPLSDTELCSLLSNGLENAVTAASALPDRAERTVTVRSRAYQGKLLLSVENPFAGEVTIRDGLPRTAPCGRETIHGYGTRSIAAIAERHGGQALFSASGGNFSLRVMLPL